MKLVRTTLKYDKFNLLEARFGVRLLLGDGHRRNRIQYYRRKIRQVVVIGDGHQNGPPEERHGVPIANECRRKEGWVPGVVHGDERRLVLS